MYYFGAGNVGQDYYVQISFCNGCNILAWVDSNWNKYRFEYANVVSIEGISKIVFDSLIYTLEV